MAKSERGDHSHSLRTRYTIQLLIMAHAETLKSSALLWKSNPTWEKYMEKSLIWKTLSEDGPGIVHSSHSTYPFLDRHLGTTLPHRDSDTVYGGYLNHG